MALKIVYRTEIHVDGRCVGGVSPCERGAMQMLNAIGTVSAISSTAANNKTLKIAHQTTIRFGIRPNRNY